MKLLTVDEWIHKRLIANQTEIIWSIIDNSKTQTKTFNIFFAWNVITGEPFESQVQLNEYLFSELNKIRDKEFELQKLITSHIDNGNFIYQPQINKTLITLCSRIEILKEEYQKKNVSRNSQIELFKNHIVWYLLDSKELAQLFIDYGLPIININNSFWWGYFGNFQRQELFFSRFEKLKVNPLDPNQLIVSDLRQTLLHIGDMVTNSSKGVTYNADAFYSRLKKIQSSNPDSMKYSNLDDEEHL